MYQLFRFEGKYLPVSFVESVAVCDGVECDVYSFVGDHSKDLGVIKIAPGCKTPKQRVILGARTVEGFISGKGKLVVTHKDGAQHTYEVDSNQNKTEFSVDVAVGDIMQWAADNETELVAYEICYPPYIDGRYENLE